jgi:hypothetical protein
VILLRHTPCSLGLSATSQQYFSLTTNQPPATSQQYSSLRTNQHQPSATSQPNRLCLPPRSPLPHVALVIQGELRPRPPLHPRPPPAVEHCPMPAMPTHHHYTAATDPPLARGSPLYLSPFTGRRRRWSSSGEDRRLSPVKLAHHCFAFLHRLPPLCLLTLASLSPLSRPHCSRDALPQSRRPIGRFPTA